MKCAYHYEWDPTEEVCGDYDGDLLVHSSVSLPDLIVTLTEVLGGSFRSNANENITK